MLLNQPIARLPRSPVPARAVLVVVAELAVTTAAWAALWLFGLPRSSLPVMLLAWGACFALYTAPVQDRLTRCTGTTGQAANLLLTATAIWFAMITTEVPSIYPVVIGALATEIAQRDSSTRTALVGLLTMFGGTVVVQWAVHQGRVSSIVDPRAADHLAVVLLAVGAVVLVRGVAVARRSASTRAELLQEQRLRHAELQYAATHDALTGLLSRRGLEPALHAACAAARPGHGVALMFLDLDGFKAINDRHGHAMGDELLAAAAVRFTKALGEDASLARMGGDEFVAVLRGVVSAAAAQEQARVVQAALDEPFRLEAVVRVGVSVGLAWADSPTRVTELTRDADLAMYRDKRRRRQIRLDELSDRALVVGSGTAGPER
ncbi:GGDEF domain-containing protein [Kineosporia babensis]|uniref:GGDEF domain-containing protein n=1 Tax=Kineosporia babensis TaxID=499548 RepID=A0A9X1NFH2_9ACTN|nr:GGDEF domain-containing protein [Kineosporia babensis]MCD5312900.1 GGDEF domain-containing protein [Kineosporia babensis]